jgi:hypothetical protein|tara:strand:+ start:49 stop:195 length:147 start_codon:yes stop_codon:yes gene_type:complete
MLTSEFVVSAVGGFLAQGQPATAAARFLIAKASYAYGSVGVLPARVPT